MHTNISTKSYKVFPITDITLLPCSRSQSLIYLRAKIISLFYNFAGVRGCQWSPYLLSYHVSMATNAPWHEAALAIPDVRMGFGLFHNNHRQLYARI